MRKVLLSVLVFFLGLSYVHAGELATVHIKDINELLDKNIGSVVMLNFFATWCPPCREEVPEIVRVAKEYKGKKVLFIGLSVDESKNRNKVEEFVKKMKISYPVYMAGRDLVLRFGIDSIPHNVFYDLQGKMVISQPGQCDAEDIRLVVEDLLGDH